jgi:multicomponent Na+:H+ antiporter subunit B
MKWVYLAAGVALFIKMLVIPNGADSIDLAIVDTIVQESGVPNAVAGIIFRNRLYDTIFEVVVFSIAILGARFLLADEKPSATIHQFTDKPSIVLAQLGATIAALVSIELAIRGSPEPWGRLCGRSGWRHGHWPGGDYLLLRVDGGVYKRWRAATVEKVSVLIFIMLAVATLIGWELPHGTLGSTYSAVEVIPLLNILVALKSCPGVLGGNSGIYSLSRIAVTAFSIAS